jgi:predicted MFS family arabinose efflux permease
MLMTGSLGMLASTLPVQWLVPVLGWRALFWCLAALVLLSMMLIVWLVPRWANGPPADAADPAVAGSAPVPSGYAAVWRHPYFRRLVPLGFFSYGGMIAMQTLWAGPWMVKVAGFSALEAATGLFWINMAMLGTFWAWGLLNPWMAKRGLGPDRLMAWGLPSSMLALALIVALGASAGKGTPLLWIFFCMGSSFITLSQPALALAFPPELAGRALSAFNLVIFAGVFAVQWGVGLGVDAFRASGLTEVAAFQAAMGLFLVTCLVSYGWFMLKARR